MLSPIIIYTVILPAKLQIYTHMTRYEFAKKRIKYNLPHIIKDTPELVLEKFLLTVYVSLCIT